MKLGYALSSEEHPPPDLVRNAQRAESAGFDFALISDHFHPWIDRQGHSPFVWSVIGAISQVTGELELGTGVTCPTMRIHPAIIAQAAATSAALMPGRFFLGLGSGENLNEHILGHRWPPYDLRAPMLEEAVEIIRLLWEGDSVTYYGDFYDVEEARIYTLPETPPSIYLAAGGTKSAEQAGRLASGLISTSPKHELVKAFRDQLDGGGDAIGMLTVCHAKDYDTALDTAFEWWPNSALPGELAQELRTPEHFEQATQLVTKEQLERSLTLGNDVETYLQSVQKFIDAGFDRIYFHQVGPDQEGFMQFFKNSLKPELDL